MTVVAQGIMPPLLIMARHGRFRPNDFFFMLTAGHGRPLGARLLDLRLLRMRWRVR
jgi:hypothetical protein